jgi:hypothetical protein
VWLRRRRNETRQERNAAIGKATADAGKSLARAEADHASEARALGRDTRLIESLREIREQNRFAATITEAFRGEP